MDETILKESKQSLNKFATVVLVIAIVLLIVGLIFSVYMYQTGATFYRGSSVYFPSLDWTSYVADHSTPYKDQYSFLEYFTSHFFYFSDKFGYLIMAGIALFLYYFINSLQMSSSQLTVTDMRIFGKASFGKAVSLPLAQITSLRLCHFSGIVVSTASGKNKFWLLENRDELCNTIAELVSKRSEASSCNSAENHSISDTQVLKEYKNLLDNGVITNEEFEAKKKKLLDL